MATEDKIALITKIMIAVGIVFIFIIWFGGITSWEGLLEAVDKWFKGGG